MNFSFNNSISFSNDGSMVIKNGSQTIKMGRGGMVIQNPGGQQIVMNNSGIQFFNQQSHTTSYSGPGFRVQTTLTTNQQDYEEESSEEESSEEMSSPESSYEDSTYWNPEDSQSESTNFQSQSNHFGWHVNHNVNFYAPNVYSYTTSQSSQMPQEQPKSKGLTKSQLNQLPVSLYNTKPKASQPKGKAGSKNKDLDNQFSSNDSCPICIVDYKFGDKLKTLPCMHRFHKDCIDKWLSMKSDCPICKYDLLD